MRETVALSFFSQHPLLTNEMKESMAFQLLSISPPDEFAEEFPFLKETLTGVLNFVTLLDLKLGLFLNV